MHKKLRSMVLFFLILAFAGCAQTQQAAKTKTGQGVAIGAAAGALAGAIIGHQSGNRRTGAVIGGLAGAAIGGGIGYKLDQQAKELQQIKDAEVRREQDRLVVTMSEAVLFDLNSAALKPGAKQQLEKMAEVMVRYPENDILVTGHTDNTGSEKYNQDLSERRAKAVKNYLIFKGISAGRITSMGFGETMPVASNATPEGRQKNRRVEIEIKPRQQPAS
ncbi:MAG: OmpA family protein [Deltaproteobacteria bacterium]|nr:OmpA family protein [Deltaproteobacteria bacterium]